MRSMTGHADHAQPGNQTSVSSQAQCSFSKIISSSSWWRFTIALISKTIRWLFRLFFYLHNISSLSHPCSLSKKIYSSSSFVFVGFLFHSDYCYRCVQIMDIFVFIESNVSGERESEWEKWYEMCWEMCCSKNADNKLSINYILMALI